MVSYCIWLVMSMRTYVRAYDIQLLRARDSRGQPETYYSACKQSGRLGSSVFRWRRNHVAVLILGDERQDPGIMTSIIEISQTDHDIQDQRWFMLDDVLGCHWKRATVWRWRWTLSLRCFWTTLSPHLCWYLPVCVLVYLPLIFNANVYILLNVVSMNHHDSWQVDSTASTSTSGRLVDLGVWVSQKTRNHPGWFLKDFDVHILLDFIGYKKIRKSIKYGASLVLETKWSMHHEPVLHHTNGEWSTSTEEPILSGSNYILCYCAGSDSGRCGGLSVSCDCSWWIPEDILINVRMCIQLYYDDILYIYDFWRIVLCLSVVCWGSVSFW